LTVFEISVNYEYAEKNKLKSKLAEGGFGEVFLMIRRSDGQLVVLKKSRKKINVMSDK